MSNTNIQTAYAQIRKFNLIAGSLTHKDHKSILAGIKLQLDLCQEEHQEAFDALTDQDAEGLLAEACDMFVVASGLLQRLENAGMNVEKALTRINDANISKFPTVVEHKNNPSLQPDNTTVLTTPYGHVVYKNTDGKVKKPTNFVKVTMFGLVPENFFGKTKAGVEYPLPQQLTDDFVKVHGNDDKAPRSAKMLKKFLGSPNA